MTCLPIQSTNPAVIEGLLKQVAGKAVYGTITTFEGMQEALRCVTSDLARRFPVPDDLDFSVRYVHAGGHCLTSELIFRRGGGTWFLESVGRRNPLPCRGPWIKYLPDAWAFSVFELFAKDGRSMNSVESTGGTLTAHQKVALIKLTASLPRRRRKKSASLT